MVCFDGFILSHTYEPVNMLSQEEVDAFLPPFVPKFMLDAKAPVSMGMYATPDYYLEFRYETDQAQKRALDVIREVGCEFGERFGRDYSALVESYRMEDAETAIVAMGSICGTTKDAIDEMRDEGKKVGLVRIRCFRPFPAEDLKAALADVQRVAVLDKNISLGAGGTTARGAVALEVRDALYGDPFRCSTTSSASAAVTSGSGISRTVVALCEQGEGDQLLRPPHGGALNGSRHDMRPLRVRAPRLRRLRRRARRPAPPEGGRRGDHRGLVHGLHGGLLDPVPGDGVEGPLDPLALRERLGRRVGDRVRPEAAGHGRRRWSSSPATARPSISGCSASRAHSSGATTSRTSATTTRPT